MDDELDFHCVQQYPAEVLEAINGDDHSPVDLAGAGERDHESLQLMAETRKLARSQGVRLRFISHRS